MHQLHVSTLLLNSAMLVPRPPPCDDRLGCKQILVLLLIACLVPLMLLAGRVGRSKKVQVKLLFVDVTEINLFLLP